MRAADRGVKIHVMARPPHSLKKEKIIEGVGGLRIMDDVGIKIHKLKHLKLHGKMLLADGVRAIVGSINLAPGSFDDRRELAIEVHDDDIVDRLHKVATTTGNTRIRSISRTRVCSRISTVKQPRPRSSWRSTRTKPRRQKTRKAELGASMRRSAFHACGASGSRPSSNARIKRGARMARPSAPAHPLS